MADQLRLFPRPATFAPGKPKISIELTTDNPSLDAFLGERSWLLFDKLNAHGTWLEKDPNEWDDDTELLRMKEYIRDLKVVNDLAGRHFCIRRTFRIFQFFRTKYTMKHDVNGRGRYGT